MWISSAAPGGVSSDPQDCPGGNRDQHGLKEELWVLLSVIQLEDVSQSTVRSTNAWSVRVSSRGSWQFFWVTGRVGKELQDPWRLRRGVVGWEKEFIGELCPPFSWLSPLAGARFGFQISLCHQAKTGKLQTQACSPTSMGGKLRALHTVGSPTNPQTPQTKPYEHPRLSSHWYFAQTPTVTPWQLKCIFSPSSSISISLSPCPLISFPLLPSLFLAPFSQSFSFPHSPLILCISPSSLLLLPLPVLSLLLVLFLLSPSLPIPFLSSVVLGHSFPMCGSQTSSSITWKFIRNANSQVPLQTYSIRCSGGEA